MKNYLLIIFLAIVFCGCERKQLRFNTSRQISNDDYSQIQNIVLDSMVARFVGREDSTLLNKKVTINVSTIDTLIITSLRENKNIIDGRWLDTTNLFNRHEFVNLINENSITVVKDSTEKQIESTNDLINLEKNYTRQANYYSKDTLGEVHFYPMIRSDSLAVQVLIFRRGMDWGDCTVYFLKKVNGRWTLVGRNIIWVS